jgi:hypothetical protein
MRGSEGQARSNGAPDSLHCAREADGQCAMKTRLLEDIDENGSAAPPLERAGGAARAPSLADTTTPNPAHAARKNPGPPDRADTAAPRFAPQPPGFHDRQADPATDPPRPPAAAIPPLDGTSPFAADGPDWLAARLQEDAALRDEPEWNSLWKRRLVAWGGAAVLLALTAAAGLWMVQESRVEGALVVVANTSPPVLPATATASTPHPPAQAEPAPGAAPPMPASAAAAGSVTPREPEPSREPASPRHRKVASAQPKPAAPEKQEPSARLRREETLMQCRAHGYDERQCLELSCVMTRFGLACRG